MKQLELGWQMYAADYDGKVNYWYQWAGANVYYWWENVQPYLKNSQILRCPSGSQDATKLGAPAGWNVASHYAPIWYAPGGYYIPNDGAGNWYFMGGAINSQWSCSAAYPYEMCDSDLGHPATAAHFVEGYGTQNPANLNQAQIGFSGFTAPGDSYRHNEGWNVAFADGHVKWVKCNSFWTSTQNIDIAKRPPSCTDQGPTAGYLSSVF